MQRSTDRILTTHVGSLPRPPELLRQIMTQQVGESVDEVGFASRLAGAVRDARCDRVAHPCAFCEGGSI